jgi:outer membrane protein assembly factor BamD
LPLKNKTPSRLFASAAPLGAQNKGAKSLILVIGLGCVIALAGCSGKPKPKVQLVYEERPVELLYNTGMSELDAKSYNDANLYFEEVQRQHPYSEWARRSIVMSIYANYMADKYIEAGTSADTFIRMYPGSSLTPYAHYMKAIIAFEQIVDVGRDQGYTVEAQRLLNAVINRYPTSEYASDARLKLDMVADQLAGKEMEIGRYYLNEKQPLAAAGRFLNVVENYQTTSHTPEALYRLVEAYEIMGLRQESLRHGAVLGHNYPGDRWYGLAYKLLTERGAEPERKPDPKGAKGVEPPKEDKKSLTDPKSGKKKSFLARINPF